MDKYNFNTIENPVIYHNQNQSNIDTSSIDEFVNSLSWNNSKIGQNNVNEYNYDIRHSFIATEKVNVILNTLDSNNIIDEFINCNNGKLMMDNSKSNITWIDR